MLLKQSCYCLVFVKKKFFEVLIKTFFSYIVIPLIVECSFLFCNCTISLMVIIVNVRFAFLTPSVEMMYKPIFPRMILLLIICFFEGIEQFVFLFSYIFSLKFVVLEVLLEYVECSEIMRLIYNIVSSYVCISYTNFYT